jgi:hypothetical protein
VIARIKSIKIILACQTSIWNKLQLYSEWGLGNLMRWHIYSYLLNRHEQTNKKQTVQDWTAYGLYPLSGFFYRTWCFGDWLCLCPQVELANLDHRWSRLACSTLPIWIGFTLLHLPEDGERASLRNVVFYRRNQMMDIVHKQVSLVHHVPSSESFQAQPKKQNPWPLVRKRTKPTERPPLVGEI